MRGKTGLNDLGVSNPSVQWMKQVADTGRWLRSSGSAPWLRHISHSPERLGGWQSRARCRTRWCLHRSGVIPAVARAFFLALECRADAQLLCGRFSRAAFHQIPQPRDGARAPLPSNHCRKSHCCIECKSTLWYLVLCKHRKALLPSYFETGVEKLLERTETTCLKLAKVSDCDLMAQQLLTWGFFRYAPGLNCWGKVLAQLDLVEVDLETEISVWDPHPRKSFWSLELSIEMNTGARFRTSYH